MSFTMIIFSNRGTSYYSIPYRTFNQGKKLSLICGILAILFALLWYLVASGILTNCG